MMADEAAREARRKEVAALADRVEAAILRRSEGIAAADLARELGTKPGRLRAALKLLQEKQLIRREIQRRHGETDSLFIYYPPGITRDAWWRFCCGRGVGT